MDKELSQIEVSVTIRHGDFTVEFRGEYEEVWRNINKYFSEVYPSLPIAKKLIGTSDVTEISELVSDSIQIVGGRVNLVTKTDAKRGIILCLAGAYVGRFLGLLSDDTLSPKEIAYSTGLSERVVRARLSELRKAGLVIKIGEGKYLFSSKSKELLGKVSEKPGEIGHI